MACQNGERDHGIDTYPTFRYRPLDTTRKCIRLLKVLPARGHAPIECQISHVSLDDRPQFIALSYKWDPCGESSKNISCNGASMQVGKNLWNFLHRYSKRRAYTGTWLWVDAICIDQSILRERNHQVSLMRNIYSRAQGVITWLGEPAGDDKITRGTKLDIDQHDSKRVCDTVDKLLKAQYWSRVWIVQEFILPRTVHIWYGSFSCNGDDFDQPWPTSVLTSLRGHQNAYTVLMHRKMWLKRTALSGCAGVDAFQVCELIRTFSFAQATETRDHIYGFLGLASAAANSDAYIKADYSKSQADVLLDVLRFERDTGVRQTQLLADYYYLRKLLKVSTFRLGQVVRNNPRGLQSHMYAMLGSSSVTAPLQLVGNVVAIQTSRERRERLKSEFNKGERRDLDGLWGIRRFKNHSDYHKELGISHRDRAHMHLKGRKRALLEPRGRPLVEEPETCSWRFNIGWPEQERDRDMIDDSIDRMFEELLRTSVQSLPGNSAEVVDFRSTFLQSFDQKPWMTANRFSQHQNPLEGLDDYTSFVGTDGIRGIIIAEPSITYQLWRHGGYGGSGIIQIWQFQGDSDCRAGLVVRKLQTKSSFVTYTPIGFAFLVSLNAAAPRFDDLSWRLLSKPTSAFGDTSRGGLLLEDSESEASDLDSSDFDELDNDSDFDEPVKGNYDLFGDDEEEDDPPVATSGSYDPFHDTNHGSIHIRVDLPTILELQRCGVLSQKQLKSIGERWLMKTDAVQIDAGRFDMDLTRR